MYFLLTAIFAGTAVAIISKSRVLYTPVFPFFPNFKQHHVVVVAGSHNSAYAFDFTPSDQGSLKTQLDLLFGKNVPGIIRVLRIPDAAGDLDITNSWKSVSEKSESTADINDLQIIRLIKRTKSWNTEMNMYTHNCQHFSAFMQGLLS
jgi:hypothetical protein